MIVENVFELAKRVHDEAGSRDERSPKGRRQESETKSRPPLHFSKPKSPPGDFFVLIQLFKITIERLKPDGRISHYF